MRILAAWDRATPAGRVVGYRYEALPGHAERGAASFELTLDRAEVRFRIESDSAPGHWLARLGAPFARRLQERATAAAFERMRAAAQAS